MLQNETNNKKNSFPVFHSKSQRSQSSFYGERREFSLNFPFHKNWKMGKLFLTFKII